MVGSKTGSPYAQSGEPKVYNGQAIKYSGAPMRGKELNKRMWADRGSEVVEAIAKRVGGRAK